jgi:hypothetical protein
VHFGRRTKVHGDSALPAMVGLDSALVPHFPGFVFTAQATTLSPSWASRESLWEQPRSLEADGRARGHDTQPPLEAVPPHRSAHLLPPFITHFWYLALSKQRINTKLAITTIYHLAAVPRLHIHSLTKLVSYLIAVRLFRSHPIISDHHVCRYRTAH